MARNANAPAAGRGAAVSLGKATAATSITVASIRGRDFFGEAPPPCALRLNTATLVGDAAACDDLTGRARALVSKALQAQGIAALAFTRAAAYHEAGHAVVNALDGIATRYVKVKLRRHGQIGLTAWLGFTGADSPWSITPATAPEDDFEHMRHILAGWAAEMLCEGANFSLASSIDEALIAGNIAVVAATKLQQEPAAVFSRVMLGTLADLKIHERHVHAIAQALMKDRIVRAPRLKRMLPAALLIRPGSRRYPLELLEELRELMFARLAGAA